MCIPFSGKETTTALELAVCYVCRDGDSGAPTLLPYQANSAICFYKLKKVHLHWIILLSAGHYLARLKAHEEEEAYNNA